MTTLTQMPPAPSRSMNPQQFVTTADAFIGALPRLVAEFNVVASEVNENANRAKQSADAAIALANASAWISGANYAKNAAAISQIDFQTYRRKIAGAGATDPKNDQVNWTLLNPLPGALTMFMYNTYGGF